jgi:polysaccharide biosynthesis transport protein
MNDTTAIFAPLWKRKWAILAVGIVVGAATYLYYKQATRVFLVETKIYLGSGSEELAPGERGTKAPKLNGGEQAALINSLIVGEVRQRLRAEGVTGLKGATLRAKSAEKSPFITIAAEAHTARFAAVFANATARRYLKRQAANRRQAITTAIAIARRQLFRFEAASIAKAAAEQAKSKSKSATSSAGNTANVLQIADVNARINQLESELNSFSARQLTPATPALARQLAPTPRKNAIFGFVIGIVLAAIGAYLFARFDRRLRSLSGIESIFGAPILTALPKVRQPVVNREGTPAPSKLLLEPMRRLHTSLSLARGLGGGTAPRGAIAFLSADPGDGKSTVVADLAIVQRDAGARTLVIDANLRRPMQARLLGGDGSLGLAEVLTQDRPLEDALQRVATARPPVRADLEAPGSAPVAVAERAAEGSLSLLASGQPVANPPAMLGSAAMADLLHTVAQDFDFVLVDTASPLEVSDAMPLLALVNAIVVVARIGHTREMSAPRLAQMLALDSSAQTLGVVANCALPKDIERYGFASSRNGRVWGPKLTRR